MTGTLDFLTVPMCIFSILKTKVIGMLDSTRRSFPSKSGSGGLYKSCLLLVLQVYTILIFGVPYLLGFIPPFTYCTLAVPGRDPLII